MIIFDGNQFAAEKELVLKDRVAELHQKGVSVKIVAILFIEDAGSQLYTGLKQQAAERVGISYQIEKFSMNDAVENVTKKLQQLNADSTVTGIIIQKPWRVRWEEVTGQDVSAFKTWWHSLVSQIFEKKDVDGLHPNTLAAIEKGTWQAEGRVLPATVRAVLEILRSSGQLTDQKKMMILGKSDILGLPLFYELKNQGFSVENGGSAELRARIKEGRALQDIDILVSSTGRQHLITGDLLKENVTIIDVGEPKPDVDFASLHEKAHFITPVPGGVGPVTVVSLLENSIQLVSF
jgi:methylenetetrahydrofolate dehydrogenase (NADP+)/methenyltetrahydrofolate cyclohydrolase